MKYFMRWAQCLRQHDLRHVFIAHTTRQIALSFIRIYIPIYLLVQGFALDHVIIFYSILHGGGLIFLFLVIVPLMRVMSLHKIIAMSYVVEVLFLYLIYNINNSLYALYGAALCGGLALFMYWTPMNILFMRTTKADNAQKDLAILHALPKFFAIIGPLIAAGSVVFFGFAPLFVLAMCGLVISAFVISASHNTMRVHVQWHRVRACIASHKKLLTLEAFDNVLEESEWFWPIFVFLVIGSLALPGVIGTLVGIGSGACALWIGRMSQKRTYRMIFFFAGVISFLWVARMASLPLEMIYMVTACAAFAMTAFVTGYFGRVLAVAKGEREVEFILAREVPTVIGRLVVFFAIIFLSASSAVFVMPIIAMIILVFLMVRWRSIFVS